MNRRGSGSKLAVASMIAMAAALGVASFAWACTNFATINLSASSGGPGTDLLVKGEGAAPSAPVVLRWDSRKAPVVAQVVTDSGGSFAVPVKVPALTQGVHVLLATDGKGSVARGAFQVGTSPGELLAIGEPGYRSHPAPGAERNWLQLGMNVLGIALVATIPVLGIAVLRRRPVAATAPAAGRSIGSEG
jgi:hypothetical protein